MIEIEDGGHGGPHHGQAPQAYSNNGMVPGKALLLFLRVPRGLLSAAGLLPVTGRPGGATPQPACWNGHKSSLGVR